MTEFILNHNSILTDEPPGRLVLDYLRHVQRLTGTKEGCKEGDCGACTVLIGELQAEGEVVYKPVTSCLLPLGELHGRHLVTIEGLNIAALTPVQEAIVAEGATQCGFCTPGIVVSITGLLMQDDLELTEDRLKKALSGHLCRCTGYRSLTAGFRYLRDKIGHNTGILHLIEAGFLPDYFRDIPQRLRGIAPAPLAAVVPGATRIAGGTDIYVQQGERLPESPVQLLNRDRQMKAIFRENGQINSGALVTFEEFGQHHEVQKIIPKISEYMSRVASWQIRNRATLGGNIINASPIGDLTILLLALQTRLVLCTDCRERTVAMTDFYRGYKQMDMEPGEILTEVQIPVPAATELVDFEKVSKRKYLDIASVNSAIIVDHENGRITKMGYAVGGVAPVPLFMRATCEFFIGQPLTANTIKTGIEVAQREIAPMSDVRGSAEYKRLLCRQLLIAHFVKLWPDRIAAGEIIRH